MKEKWMKDLKFKFKLLNCLIKDVCSWIKKESTVFALILRTNYINEFHKSFLKDPGPFGSLDHKHKYGCAVHNTC